MTDCDQATDALLAERKTTHGDFNVNSKIVQDIKRVFRGSPNWEKLTPPQAEALDMVAHKFGRILTGDQNFRDSWSDCLGYLRLVERELT